MFSNIGSAKRVSYISELFDLSFFSCFKFWKLQCFDQKFESHGIEVCWSESASFKASWIVRHAGLGLEKAQNFLKVPGTEHSRRSSIVWPIWSKLSLDVSYVAGSWRVRTLLSHTFALQDLVKDQENQDDEGTQDGLSKSSSLVSTCIFSQHLLLLVELATGLCRIALDISIVFEFSETFEDERQKNIRTRWRAKGSHWCHGPDVPSPWVAYFGTLASVTSSFTRKTFLHFPALCISRSCWTRTACSRVYVCTAFPGWSAFDSFVYSPLQKWHQWNILKSSQTFGVIWIHKVI